MTVTVNLLTEDIEKITRALLMHKCYIETGDPILSAEDAKNMGRRFNALTVEQMRGVVAIQDLVDRLFNAMERRHA